MYGKNFWSTLLFLAASSQASYRVIVISQRFRDISTSRTIPFRFARVISTIVNFPRVDLVTRYSPAIKTPRRRDPQPARRCKWKNSVTGDPDWRWVRGETRRRVARPELERSNDNICCNNISTACLRAFEEARSTFSRAASRGTLSTPGTRGSSRCLIWFPCLGTSVDEGSIAVAELRQLRCPIFFVLAIVVVVVVLKTEVSTSLEPSRHESFRCFFFISFFLVSFLAAKPQRFEDVWWNCRVYGEIWQTTS